MSPGMTSEITSEMNKGMMMQISLEEMIAMMKQAKMMDDGQIEQMVMMKAQQQGQGAVENEPEPMNPNVARKQMVNQVANGLGEMRKSKAMGRTGGGMM